MRDAIRACNREFVQARRRRNPGNPRPGGNSLFPGKNVDNHGLKMLPELVVHIAISSIGEGANTMKTERIGVGPRMSQAVIHGETVYLSGQVAIDARGAPVADQTKNILERIDALLAEAGTDKSKLLTATIWLSDMSGFEEMNGVWDAWVAPGETPCRACVESKLAFPDFTVEIQVIAAR